MGIASAFFSLNDFTMLNDTFVTFGMALLIIQRYYSKLCSFKVAICNTKILTILFGVGLLTHNSDICFTTLASYF